MNEKGANIDLLFRNGLKDFEVIPPPGVWDGIHSAIKIKSRQYIFLKIAAAVTVLLTLSFLTYSLSRQISVVQPGTEISLNVPDYSPVLAKQGDRQQFLAEKKYAPSKNVPDILPEAISPVNNAMEGEVSASSDQILKIQETNNLYLTKNDFINVLSLYQLILLKETIIIQNILNYNIFRRIFR